jgi:hypothetical protein
MSEYQKKVGFVAITDVASIFNGAIFSFLGGRFRSAHNKCGAVIQQADPPLRGKQGLAGIDIYLVIEFVEAWFARSLRRENLPPGLQ